MRLSKLSRDIFCETFGKSKFICIGIKLSTNQFFKMKLVDINWRLSFDPNVKILHMHVWSFAYQEARKSNWIRNAADRFRFELKMQRMETMLAKIGFLSRK